MNSNEPNTYNPDKDTRKDRIVVGLSGSLDSLVTAYLLKIQKYDVIAVTVAISWESFSGDQSEVLSCYMNAQSLNTIKEFCQQLNIPHHIVKSFSEFQENIVEEWVSSRLSGTNSNACWSCHELRMKVLYQKMKQLGVNSLATGHFAKLFYQEAHDAIYVHSSNDDQYDQSALLSRLPKEILKVLHLPLSDLQKKEVIKLSENFALDGAVKRIKMHQCFPQNEQTTNYLVEKVPSKIVKPGEILSGDGSSSFGGHEGVIYYPYGEPLPSSDQRKADFFIAKFIGIEKKVVVEKESFFLRTELFLTECHISDDTQWGEPMKGYLKLEENFIDCWIHPKSLNAAYIEWEGQHYVKEGEIVSIHRKKGKNSKVYLTGKTSFLIRPVEVQGDKNVKIDYSRDF